MSFGFRFVKHFQGFQKSQGSWVFSVQFDGSHMSITPDLDYAFQFQNSEVAIHLVVSAINVSDQLRHVGLFGCGKGDKYLLPAR